MSEPMPDVDRAAEATKEDGYDAALAALVAEPDLFVRLWRDAFHAELAQRASNEAGGRG